MKLKYYLRGLGIGIIVTALLLSIADQDTVNANDNQQTIEAENETQQSEEDEQTQELSTEHVIETLPVQSNVEQTKEDIMHEVDTQAIQESIETFETGMTDEDSSQSENETSEQETTVEEEETQSESAIDITDALSTDESAKESYLLNVVRGDDSGTVSRKLQNVGLIDNAAEFDAYLMQHGYDKKISIGTVEIPMGSTWIEIAEKLAGK